MYAFDLIPAVASSPTRVGERYEPAGPEINAT